MRPPEPWLLVFDLDGTLIDSSVDLCAAVNAAMVYVGAPELPQQIISSFIGDGAATLVRRALGAPSSLHDGLAGQQQHEARFTRAFNFFLEFYRDHKLDNTRLYEGVLPALQTLRCCHPGLPMAVLTNKPVRPSREICDALGISPFLFANYGGDSFELKKPDPTGLQKLMSQARGLWAVRGVDPRFLPLEGVVMVGDSDIDVQTARRAGVRSLGCRYGLTPDTLVLAKPDLLCDQPAEWPGLLLDMYPRATP